MSFEAYLIKEYDYTHENEFFRKLYHEMKKKYDRSNERCVLIGNISCNGHEIDALFIKNGQITILEFKDYSGRIEFSENNPWKIWQNNNFIFVAGGSKIRNPFQQIKAYRYSLFQFLEDNQNKILKNHTIRWDHVNGIVLFSQEIQFDNDSLPPNIKKYFFIADFNVVFDRLSDLNDPNLNLSDNEIENILKVLDVRPENIYNSEFLQIEHRNDIQLNRIQLAKKLLPETLENSEIKRILQYYRTLVNLERYKEPTATEIHKYSINWAEIEYNFYLNLSLNPEFNSLFLKNLQERFPRNLFIGVNVLIENHEIPVLYNIILVSEIDNPHDNILINFDEFQLFIERFERLGLPEDQLEELISKINQCSTLQEKLDSINDFIGTPIVLVNSLSVGLSNESLYSIQLLSELKKLIKYDDNKFKDGIIGPFLKNKEIELPTEKFNFDYILHLTPLNSSQKKSITLSFQQPLTVITGPPGTGKSQVVLNIIANAIVNGKTVLFASKNNKAVDTVKERMDSVLEEKYLLRFGPVQEIKTQTKPTIKYFINKKNEDQFFDLEEEKILKHEELLSLEEEILSIVNKINRITILKKEIKEQDKKLNSVKEEFNKWKNSFPSEFQSFFITNNYQLDLNENDLIELYKKVEFYNRNFLTRIIFYLFFKNKIKNEIISFDKLIQEDIFNFIQRTYPLVSAEKSIITSFFEHIKFTLKIKTESDKIILEKKQKLSSIKNIADKLSIKKLELKELLENKDDLLEKYFSLVNKGPEKGLSYLNTFINQKLYNLEIPEIQNYIDLIPDNIPWRSEEISSFEYASKQFLKNFSAICVTSLSVKNGFPLTKEMFDLLIIDEASQCDIASAIPLIYRTKNVVVIGDPLQLTHITNIQKEEEQFIIDQLNLNNNNLNYIEKSLWDYCFSLANRSGYESVILNEHYRCHPDIIRFSNIHFYGPKLGQTLEIRTRPEDFKFDEGGIVWINVEGQVHERRNENIAEASKSKELANDLVNRYPDASIGIVTPFRHQYEYIFEIIDNNLRSKIKVDTVHKYQGDEKDIIIFSLVVTSGCRPSLHHFINYSAPYLLNVAVTRAKSTLYIIGDFDFCVNLMDENGPTLLSKLAKYVASNNKVKFN